MTTLLCPRKKVYSLAIHYTPVVAGYGKQCYRAEIYLFMIVFICI